MKKFTKLITNAQHTPAPWETYRLSPDSDPRERLIVVTADGETEICGVIDNEADARLIAASPRVLKALEAAEQAIEEATDIMHYEDGQPVTALEGWEIERAYLALCGVLVEVDQAVTAARGSYRRHTARTPALLAAAELVIARWSSGDLAEAVRLLDRAVTEAKRGTS